MTTAVLVMAYGTPTGKEDVETFYTDVRRGRPPSEEQLSDLVRRYDAIGGISPLNERTVDQVDALQRALEAEAPGRFVTYYGAKHARPKIEEVVADIANDGISSMIGVVLAPHYSVLSVGDYIERAAAAAARHDLRAEFVMRWGDDEALVALLAARVAEALDELGGPPATTEVVFTAHSLPTRVLELGDRYPDELLSTASLVARRAGLTRFRTGWQSAGRTPEPWLGPDLLQLMATVAAEGVTHLVVCPAGFTSDHLEVLYDLDIEARVRAHELGLGFVRTRSLNDDPELGRLLARHVVALVPSLDARCTPDTRPQQPASAAQSNTASRAKGRPS